MGEGDPKCFAAAVKAASTEAGDVTSRASRRIEGEDDDDGLGLSNSSRYERLEGSRAVAMRRWPG